MDLIVTTSIFYMELSETNLKSLKPRGYAVVHNFLHMDIQVQRKGNVSIKDTLNPRKFISSWVSGTVGVQLMLYQGCFVHLDVFSEAGSVI